MVDPTERLSGPYAPMKKRPLEYIQKVINSKIEPSKSILDIDKFKKNPPASFTIPDNWLRGLPELKFILVNDTDKAFVYAVITNQPIFECFLLIYWREKSKFFLQQILLFLYLTFHYHEIRKKELEKLLHFLILSI